MRKSRDRAARYARVAMHLFGDLSKLNAHPHARPLALGRLSCTVLFCAITGSIALVATSLLTGVGLFLLTELLSPALGLPSSVAHWACVTGATLGSFVGARDCIRWFGFIGTLVIMAAVTLAGWAVALSGARLTHLLILGTHQLCLAILTGASFAIFVCLIRARRQQSTPLQ